MKLALYKIWQCTWGFLQTLLGLFMFLIHNKSKHFWYHGALVTAWKLKSSVSLGMFVFVADEPFFAKKYRDISIEEHSKMLLVHEYGHTIQSLILGPLYLILMGIPSTVWGFLPSAAKLRKEKQVSYFSFFTESWANVLGERVTGEKSMESLVID
jgi:hypothetical protein